MAGITFRTSDTRNSASPYEQRELAILITLQEIMRERTTRRAPLSLVKATLVLERGETLRGTPTFFGYTREFLFYFVAAHAVLRALLARTLPRSVAAGYKLLPRAESKSSRLAHQCTAYCREIKS